MLPTFTVKLALDDPWNAVAPAYTTIPARITAGTIRRGRSYIYSQAEAGELDLEFEDRLGVLDPENPGSPYFGRLGLSVRIQLLATQNGNVYPQFTGLLKGVPVSYPGIYGRRVRLQATDGLARLARTKKSLTFPVQTSGARAVQALDLAMWAGTGLYTSANNRDIDAGISTLSEYSIQQRSMREVLDLAERSEGGRAFVDGGGAFVFIERHAAFSPPYSAPNAVFGNLPGDIPYTDITPDYSTELVYNEVTGSLLEGAERLVFDTASQAQHGINTLPMGELALQTRNELQDRLYYALGQHKQPLKRFQRIEVKGDDHTNWPVILGHELGYRETVRRLDPNYGLLTSQEVHLERMEKTIDEEGFGFRVTYEMSLADPNVGDYWRLGTHNLTTAKWAY